MSNHIKNDLILAFENHPGFENAIYMTYHVEGRDTLDFDEAQELLNFFEHIDELYYLNVGTELLEAYIRKENVYYVVEFFYDTNHFSSFSTFWHEDKNQLLNLSENYNYRDFFCNKNLPDKLSKIDEKIELEKILAKKDKTKNTKP